MALLAFGVGLATLALIYGLLSMGLNLQFGFGGVINFGYVAFFAVGAFASALVTLPVPGSAEYVAAGSLYTVALGWPIWAGFVAAAAVAALLALFIGSVTARLETHYLAVATFALAEVVRAFLGNEVWLTRGEFGIASVPKPFAWLSPDSFALAYLALAVGVVGVIFAALNHLGEAPFGRVLRAVRDDALAARVLGKDAGAARRSALMIGGAIGGVAGALWTHSLGIVHVGQFVPLITFQIWLAMLMGGTGNPLGALLGAALLIAIREGTRFVGEIPGLDAIAAGNPSFLPSLRFVLIGVLLILVVRFFPRGILPERVRRAPVAGLVNQLSSVSHPVSGPPILEVSGLRRSFGGLKAVDGAEFSVRRGSITGLIGPNGAGKSTMMDLLSGVQRADAGSIRFNGRDLSRLPPEAIARAGVGRTFQTPRLFSGMTVWENLMASGLEPEQESLRRAMVRRSGRAPAERIAAARAEAVLRQLEIVHMRDALAGTLSGGQRKLLSMGRLMMKDRPLLLLDEPAAGVNRRLAEQMFETIAGWNRAGATFLIVEHEMSLVMRYCDHVIVMHQGRVLAEGTPDEVRADPRVIDAYLGGVLA